MKTALQLGHELTNETQQAITEAISARDREVRAATLRWAADELSTCDTDDGEGITLGVVTGALRIWAERAERGEQ